MSEYAHHMYGTEGPASHGGSFSSVASAPVSQSFEAYHTPVSSHSGRSSPSSMSYTNVQLDMTPPGSATNPYFSMNVPAVTSPAALSPTHQVSGYMSTSSFPQHPPATPERNNSVSSHMSSGGSPVGSMMQASYPASVSSMTSMTSASSIGSAASPHNEAIHCSPSTPEAYPFTDMAAKGGSYSLQGSQQQSLPVAYGRDSHPSSGYMFPTPGSAQQGLPPHDGSDISPSEFCWSNTHTAPHAHSPPINYFGERSAGSTPLPPLPPSATLKSSVIKSDGAGDYPSPGDDRRFSASTVASGYDSPSRRPVRYVGAQLSARALQDAVTQHPSYNTLASAMADGTIVTRNGIQVSKVASGAYQCLVPGCPSRPFKRSEHLKRHVTT